MDRRTSDACVSPASAGRVARLAFWRAAASLVSTEASSQHPPHRIVILFAWLALTILLAHHHVFWRDEVRAFSIALAGDDLLDMLRGLQRRGTPGGLVSAATRRPRAGRARRGPARRRVAGGFYSHGALPFASAVPLADAGALRARRRGRVRIYRYGAQLRHQHAADLCFCHAVSAPASERAAARAGLAAIGEHKCPLGAVGRRFCAALAD